METYKTFKSSNKENTVEAFKNQYNNITILVNVNSKEYSLEYFDDETTETRTKDFLSEYGTNENSLKAIELISLFISNL